MKVVLFYAVWGRKRAKMTYEWIRVMAVFSWNVRFHVSAFRLMGKCLMMINCGIFFVVALLFTFFHFSFQPLPSWGMWHRKNLRSIALMTSSVSGFSIEHVPTSKRFAFIYLLKWTLMRVRSFTSMTPSRPQIYPNRILMLSIQVKSSFMAFDPTCF